MANQRTYHVPNLDVQRLGDELVRWYRQQGLEAQVLTMPGDVRAVQARTPQDWRAWVGGASALTVTLTPRGADLTVEVGAARWVDKAALGVATLILFWPLVILPALGAYQQMQLIDRTYQFIEEHLATKEEAPVNPWEKHGEMPPPVSREPLPTPVTSSERAAPASDGMCPSCGRPVRVGANFCPNCGTRLTQTCNQCGSVLQPGDRFCDHCGALVETARGS